MNKGIHNDFLICADAMLACFNSIEENKAWDLMPEFLPELAKCIHMMNRELNIHLLEAEFEKKPIKNDGIEDVRRRFDSFFSFTYSNRKAISLKELISPIFAK